MFHLLVTLTHLPSVFFCSLCFEDSGKQTSLYLHLFHFTDMLAHYLPGFLLCTIVERDVFLCSPAKINETH